MIEFELKMSCSCAVSKEKCERLSEYTLMREVEVNKPEVLFFLI
jgi:hypothetical protein